MVAPTPDAMFSRPGLHELEDDIGGDGHGLLYELLVRYLQDGLVCPDSGNGPEKELYHVRHKLARKLLCNKNGFPLNGIDREREGDVRGRIAGLQR